MQPLQSIGILLLLFVTVFGQAQAEESPQRGGDASFQNRGSGNRWTPSA